MTTRYNRRWTGSALAVLLAAALATGCASHSADAGSSTAPKTQTSYGVDATLTHAYSSITDLKQHAAAVVLATVTGPVRTGPADQAGTSNVLASVTQLHVDEVLYGSVGGATTINIRQIVAARSGESDTEVRLAGGSQLVGFLQRFTFGPGQPSTGQWVFVGGNQGAYSNTQGSLRTLAKFRAPTLPATITLPNLEKQIAS